MDAFSGLTDNEDDIDIVSEYSPRLSSVGTDGSSDYHGWQEQQTEAGVLLEWQRQAEEQRQHEAKVRSVCFRARLQPYSAHTRQVFHATPSARSEPFTIPEPFTLATGNSDERHQRLLQAHAAAVQPRTGAQAEPQRCRAGAGRAGSGRVHISPPNQRGAFDHDPPRPRPHYAATGHQTSNKLVVLCCRHRPRSSSTTRCKATQPHVNVDERPAHFAPLQQTCKLRSSSLTPCSQPC